MQILIISSKFPFPLKDGGAIATFNLMSGLAKQDNNIFLLSFNTKKHFVESEKINDPIFKKIKFACVYIDTTPHIFRAIYNLLFSNLPYILKRFKSEEFEQNLVKILTSSRFDIVQIEGLYMMQYVKKIRLHSEAKIAYRPHNIEFQIWNQLGNISVGTIKKKYYKILSNRILKYELSLLNNYDLLIPISYEDAGFYVQIGNTKPQIVIPTGFDIENKPIYEFNPSKPSIFFIGSLEWKPNQEAIQWFLNFCWKKLFQQFPHLKWYIAGRNAPVNLKKLFEKPGIVWMGEIENSLQFITNKSIMIVPLQSGSGMRIKIIEAFMHAKPVVSTTLGARGTKTEDNENILLADSPDDFVSQISRLIEQPHFYQKIANNCFKHSKNTFNNNLISNSLMNFYKQQTSTNDLLC